jgi:dTDP-4-amino-4,6-dideoxygalactose transaminase
MIRFSSPAPVGREQEYMAEAIGARTLAGVGPFAVRCERWLEARHGGARVLLTGSCTGALEMAALLLDIAPGDEVILPSFTFCTTASAFALRGARLVFADIDPQTLCMGAREVEPALGPRTRAVVGVHYAGYGGDAPALAALCRDRGVDFVEDAAQSLLAEAGGRPLGTFGRVAALSFHDTKNVTAGEGGALVVNDPALVERALVLRDKGTNRAQFFRGEVDKYTWTDLGSSFVPSELNAAYLFGQLEHADAITARRLAIARRYRAGLAAPAAAGGASIAPERVIEGANGHLFWILLANVADRQAFIAHLKSREIAAVHHYVPLHSSPAGRKHGAARGELPVTDDIWQRLVRLPLHMDLSDADVDRVIAACVEFLEMRA